jgi:hypothetical protein
MIRSALSHAPWRKAAIATAVAAACALHPATHEFVLPSAVAQETVRAEVGKPLQQARDLIKANKHKEALAKLREVDAVPNRTANENFLLEQMRASAAGPAGDLEQAIKSFTFLINSGRLSEADTGRYAAGLGGLYYRQRDFKSAASWYERALKANPNDAATRALLIQAYFEGGDMASAQREALADVQAAEKAGRVPPESQLQLLANIAARNTADRNAYFNALERLVTHYPKREYWADLLRRIEGKPGWSNRLSVDLYRLRAATRTLASAADYSEYAQLALQEQQAGEAKRILDEGFAAGVLGKGAEAERQQRLLALATQRAADAPKALAEAEKEAAADKDGNNLVRIGFGYSGLGQHDKGIALMQQGIAKGGLKRKDDATLHLGIALHRAGQKQRAAQVLRTVGGTDGTADLARLWMKVP